MGLTFEQIFDGTGFFAEYGDNPLDLMDGGKIVGG